MDDRPIFIVGLGRSGSTLWQNIITHNPKILRIGEMHYLAPFRKDFRWFCSKYVGDLKKDENIEKMVELLFSNKVVKGIHGWFWEKEIKKVDNQKIKDAICIKIKKSKRSVEEIFKIIIKEYAKCYKVERCCIKFPVYPNFIPELIRWYPGCKIVHITRDPRATAVSKTNDSEGTRRKIEKYPCLKWFIEKTMIYFVTYQYWWTSKIHLECEKNENYALFKYEDLLADPECVVKKLCEFIGIGFKPGMLNPKKGQESSITRKKVGGIDKEAANRWEKVISPFDKWMITVITRNSMKRFGYEPKR